MRDEAGGEGNVIHIPIDAARPFRRFLLRAWVDRPELHQATRTSKAMTFYDCRATGITWQAIREPLRIMQRAGHRDFATTMVYVRTAEELRRGFGEPFPALPQCVLGEYRPRIPSPALQVTDNWRKRTGIEPDETDMVAEDPTTYDDVGRGDLAASGRTSVGQQPARDSGASSRDGQPRRPL